MGWMRCSVMTDPAMSDLFALACFKWLIYKAGQAYGTVIIDTPQILLAPTVRIVAEQADAILLMVQSDRTRRRKIEEAMRAFRNMSTDISITMAHRS